MSRAVGIVLVGYDGFSREEPVPVAAVELARAHGAELHVLNVVPEMPRVTWKAKEVAAEELQQALAAHRQAKMEELLEPIRASGLPAHCRVRAGRPQTELIREATECGADLLVVVDEPIFRDGRRGFGTVTTKLLRECPCPVLAVRSTSRLKPRRVIAAVDVQPFDDEPNTTLGQRVVEVAASLARHAKSELIIFNAWSMWGEDLLRSPSRLKDHEVDDLLRRTEEAHRQRLQQVIDGSRLGDIEPEIHVAKGEARRILIDDYNDEGDLIVMGTVSRTGLPGVVIGNTAERLINKLQCAVLAVKPEGFVSPVASIG